ISASGVANGTGYSARIGGMLAWGAPWNDGIFGFAAQLGAPAGVHTGDAYAQSPCFYSGTGCWTPKPGETGRDWFLSAYIALSFVAQAPLRGLLCRFAGLSVLFVPAHTGHGLLGTFDAGVAWQAF